MATRKTARMPPPPPGPAAAMLAIGDVIARRMTILGDAAADPGRADVREMALMSTEKVEAFSASASVVARETGRMAADLGRAAADEAAHAARALSSASGSPQALAAATHDYWFGAWTRAAGHASDMNARLLALQTAAWAPIGAAAVANARRLKR